MTWQVLNTKRNEDSLNNDRHVTTGRLAFLCRKIIEFHRI